MPLDPAFVEELRAKLSRARWLRELGASRDDVLQETLAIMSTVPAEKINIPYALTVARNIVHRMERATRQRPHHDLNEEVLPDSAPRADEVIQAHEEVEWLSEAWATLPERDQRILELRLADGLSILEIAAITGLSPTAVARAYTRALMKLRNMRAD